MKTTLIATATAIGMAMTAHGASAYIVEDARDASFQGQDFTAELAREYQGLATFEGYEMYDWPDAETFARKSLSAGNGSAVAPENPATWNIDEEDMPALRQGFQRLNTALSAGAAQSFPKLAAVAQVQYDCWVEQQEEDHQPTHIAACRAGFEEAMARLEAAMAPPVRVATPAPVQTVQVGDTETVYFEWDEDEIEPEAANKLDNFINRVQNADLFVMRVTGHADRSGPVGYNYDLGGRRAEAVRNYLLNRGLNVEPDVRVVLESEGETQPAVPTADGVRHPLSRRAVVEVRANQTINPQVSQVPRY